MSNAANPGFNKRMGEARRIEQDVYQKRKAKIPRKIFPIGGVRFSEEKKQKADDLLVNILLYRVSTGQKRRLESYIGNLIEVAFQLLDKIIFNLKLAPMLN